MMHTSCTQTKYVGGIQINEASQEEWAKTLKACGMNSAQVTAYAKQGVWNTDQLWWEHTDTINAIKQIRALKSEGIHVIMVLRVALQHSYETNGSKWHGMIYPNTKERKERWFYRYNYFVQVWAKLCEREGVEVFAISSELNAMNATKQILELPELVQYFANEEAQLAHDLKILPFENQLKKYDLWEFGKQVDTNINQYLLNKIESNINWTREVYHWDRPEYLTYVNKERQSLDSNWRAVIAEVRENYRGKVTIASNFDNYHEVSYWDALDFIGINAYFALRTMPQKPLSDEDLYLQLVQGWEGIFSDLDKFKNTHQLKDKPIFFTEIGYTPKQYATAAPWTGHGYSLLSTEEFDTVLVWDAVANKPEERAMAINALYQVTKKEKIPLIGINYWKLTSHAYHAGYEPFMLLIKEDEVDPLQSALTQFLRRSIK